ncbi:hypothetical protein SCLCIDRAFT_95581, partial [Scleroderma citrinum Foug A]
TCAIPITWFSCTRELFHAAMGVLVGHYNGYKRREILHSNLSDSNIWMRIEAANSACTVPEWQEMEDLSWYPWRSGILGDWGLRQDVSSTSKTRSNDDGFITGTFPFQAAELIQPPVQVPHRLNHDLEAFFWVIWIICVNVNGPFNHHRQW